MYYLCITKVLKAVPKNQNYAKQTLKIISKFKFFSFYVYHMTIVNISNHGRITIPSEMRKKYGWKDGDKVIIIDHSLEGIKILPYLSDKNLQSILDMETSIKIIEEISEERKLEIEIEKEKLYQRQF